MSRDYPEMYEHLKALMGRLAGEAPGVMRGIGALHAASTAGGVLSTKFKELWR
jgi:hypothetical protein